MISGLGEVRKIVKGDKVIYIDKSNNILENGKEYKVNEVLPNGAVQIEIKTGFAGLTKDRFKRIL
jgi:uncharacterized protein YrrD